MNRYVIFTSDELGLETYLGSGAEAKRTKTITRTRRIRLK